MKAIRKLSLLALSLLVAPLLCAETMEFTFDFSSEDVTVSPPNANGEVGVDLKDGYLGEGNPGKPWIPYRTFSVRLPEGEGIVDWSVEAGAEIPLADGVIVAPEQAPYIPSLGPAPVTPRDEAAYASADVYPAKDGELLQVGHMRGVAIATFRLNPIGYVAAEKKLSLVSSLKVKITTAVLPRTTGVAERPIPRSQIFEDAINSMVVNPDTRLRPQTTSVARNGSGCEYLIICAPAFLPFAQQLAEFRRDFNNLTVEVVTTDSMVAGGKTYSKTWSDIRAFITWYVQNKGTEYVFLMGNDTDIPPNKVTLTVDPAGKVTGPSDLYFSDLDSTSDNQPALDYLPDVYVGRLPFSSSSEGSYVSRYVQKVIDYERNTTDDSDIVRKMFWGGFTLANELVRTTQYAWQDYEVSKSAGTATPLSTGIVINETFGDGLTEVKADVAYRPIGDWVNDKEMWGRRMNAKYHRKYYPNMRSCFMFGSATTWDTSKAGDHAQNVANFSAALNRGYHQLFMDTHGSSQTLALEGNKTKIVDSNSGSSSYWYSDAMALTNRIDFMFIEACDGGHYDGATCPAEGFLAAPGGSLGVMAGVRYTFAQTINWSTPGSVTGLTRNYAMNFFNRVLVEHDATIGKAFAISKADGRSQGTSGAGEWTQKFHTLFGDPMLTYHVPATESRTVMDQGLATLLRDTPIATTADSATIRVAADEIPLGKTAKVQLQYSTSDTFASATTVDVASGLHWPEEFSKTIMGLSPQTTYYVRARISLSDGAAWNTSPFNLSFMTKAANGVEGTIRNGVSLPVVGVTVQAKSGGTVTASAVTDSHGYYYIPLAAGWSGTLSVQGASGSVNPAEPALTIAAGQTKTIDFTIEQVYFVKQGATGTGDGSSWANAFTSLATAFANVPAGAALWVAQGTYYPDTSEYGRDSHFAPPANVSVYGGFTGTESNLGQRDWIAHPTILSGDIGTTGTWSDNCYHVVRYNFGVRLDGLVIRDGYLDQTFNTGDDITYARGSAIGSPRSNPAPANGTYLPTEPVGNLMIVEHCRITHNYGKITGGTSAQPNGQLSVQFIAYRNCLIDNNESPSSEALLKFCYLDHCTVTENTSAYNIANDATVRNSIVYGNTYTASGSMVTTEAYNKSTAIAPVFFYWTKYGGVSGNFLTESCVRYAANYPTALVWYKENPGWVHDVSGFEYALAADSYAADKGMELDWIDDATLDYLCNPRRYGMMLDLGCCEASLNSAPGSLKLDIREGSAATLNTLSVQARVIDFGTNATTQALSVEYSTSSEFKSASTKSAGTASNGGTDWLTAVTIGSLTPNTTYYLRAIATVGGKKTASPVLALTTQDYGAPALTVSAGTATRSTLVVNWSLSALGDGNTSATVYIDYGTSDSFGSTVTAKTGATSGASGSVTLEGLSAQQTYYVRARAVAAPGGKAGESSTITPKTADMGDPTGGSIAVGTLGQRQTEVVWTVGTLGEGASSADVYVEWSTDTGYSNSQKVKTGAAAGASGTFMISGLDPSTKYNVRVRIVNDGGKSVTQTGSFTTKQETSPTATGSLGTPGYKSVPVTVNLTSFGGTFTSVSVLLEAFTNPGMTGTPAATLLRENVTSLGDLVLGFEGLAMGTTYYLRATVTNGEGGMVAVNLGSITTKEVEELPIGQGYWQAGFAMGYEFGASGETYAAAQVSGSTYSGMTSQELVLRPETAFIRSQEQTVITINGHDYTVIVKDKDSTKVRNSLFCYEGEMWMEKGVTNYFASNMANIQTVSIDGEVVLTDSYGGQRSPVTASYTPKTTGWHAFKVAHAAGSGYFGACDRCTPPTGMLVTTGPFWDDKIGIAWSTNITIGLQYQSYMNDAKWAAQWTPLGDAGDRHLFRVRGTQPPLVSIDAAPSFTSNGFTIPVETDAVDADCTLTLYYGNSGDAWYFENRWAGKKSVSVATGSVLTDMAVTGVTVGDGIWVSARLKSSDGSYDCWTDPVYCEKTGTVVTPPSGTVASSDVSFTTSKVTATLTDKGSEAANSDVTITLVVSKNSDYSSPVFNQTVTSGTAQSLTGLATGTKYYVKATFTGKVSGNSTATTTFTTSTYTAPTANPPTVGSVTKSGATVTVSNIAWGNGSTGGTVKIEILQGATVVKTLDNLTGAGSYDFTGLTANTQYKVRVTYTGSNGLTLVDESQTFTTEAEPPAPFVTLSAATATVGADGTSATLSVTVEDTNVSGGALVLTLNGAETKRWTLAKGSFSQDVTVTPGSTNTFSFVASGEGVTETANGSFVTKLYVGWFDVKFGDSGFKAGTDWIATSTDKSGGTFAAAEGTETELVKDAVSSVSVKGEIDYTPSHASDTDADVRIEGRVQTSMRTAEPTITGVKAAFYLVSGTKARVYGANGWTDLAGSFADDAWLDYVLEFDYSSESAPRVRYTIGSATSDWIAITAATRNVQMLGFRDGTFSDFAAGYCSITGDEPIVLEKPEFVTDGSALAFGGAAGSETFSLTISNPVKGAYYTVFTSTTLEGTFTAEKASVLCDSSAATYTLTVDADTPTKFAKIVISLAPFAAGAPLPAK